jgi:ATP-dependent DNA helicase PIF1
MSLSFYTPSKVTLRFISGPAGSGKTYQVKERARLNPKSVLLTGTTGIASINLGGTTWWSTLRTRPDSIERDFRNGALRERLGSLANEYGALAIDEASMLPAPLLDLLVNACDELGREFTLELIGDFCQLPPIPEEGQPEEIPWAFRSAHWPRFETRMLQGSFRQVDERFLYALNGLRCGMGEAAAEVLKDTARWTRKADCDFAGTTIFATNANVDRYNATRFAKLPDAPTYYRSARWGIERSEWKNVPHVLELKEDAYVMVLANDTSKDLDGNSQFCFVNGDCGHIVACEIDRVLVQLVRDGSVQAIKPIVRKVLGEEEDLIREFGAAAVKEAIRGRKLPDGSYWSKDEWIRGAITYMPIRLAYASTTHKSQGLTLAGAVAINLSENFFGSPAMSYVAASRATKAENLTFIGTPAMLAKRTKAHAEVSEWF